MRRSPAVPLGSASKRSIAGGAATTLTPSPVWKIARFGRSTAAPPDLDRRAGGIRTVLRREYRAAERTSWPCRSDAKVFVFHFHGDRILNHLKHRGVLVEAPSAA